MRARQDPHRDPAGTLGAITEFQVLDRTIGFDLSPLHARADELAMLEMTATPVRAGSRLSCQIVLDPSIEGLTVETPVAQY